MNKFKTAHDIVVDLIDRREITGEEAYTLTYELVHKNSWTPNIYPNITSPSLNTDSVWSTYTDSTIKYATQNNLSVK